MGKFYDSVPVSAIVRIRDMMYTVKDPFRLDQGDVSFDAPETFKQAVAKAMTENRTHYLPTVGIPPLRKAFAEKMRKKDKARRSADKKRKNADRLNRSASARKRNFQSEPWYAATAQRMSAARTRSEVHLKQTPSSPLAGD